VFEYAYFLDNWGWLYSSAMTVRGNVRANGPFGFGGHAPTIEAQPRPHRVDVLPTGGYDLDGLRDGGGVYAGWAITGQSALQGSAANAVNQHGFQDPVAMPELQSLALQEALALQLGSSVTVSAGLLEPITLGPVIGDGAGEAQHLYLFGTASQPIRIDGPIVVRGNVYLAGVVSGRGAIYAGGNVYVGDDLVYLNPPVPLQPATFAETDVETWLAQNAARDALGLYAREHIVIGDASTSEFQNAISPWLTDTRNQSAEVAVGIDGIHNTLAGRDGVLGTDDDDVLEDTAWNVSYYTTQHLAQGLVPHARLIGDVIPGSVEDKDGDGQVDGTIVLADLIPTATVWAETWAGNRLGGLSYADVATNDIDRIDAALCSAHALAGRLNSTGTIRLYGCLASRNEALVFAAPAVEMLHDVRLLLDQGSPFFPPNAWRNVRSWPVSDFDMSAAGSGINVGS
ncbi:MAG: hypothetical protein H6834_18270, partial [Planctomycetes bacterium]|nr:hypothetical protein [Planctomycetota bacterium]